MNSLLRIQISVASRQALKALKEIDVLLKQLGASASTGAVGLRALERSLDRIKFDRNKIHQLASLSQALAGIDKFGKKDGLSNLTKLTKLNFTNLGNASKHLAGLSQSLSGMASAGAGMKGLTGAVRALKALGNVDLRKFSTVGVSQGIAQLGQAASSSSAGLKQSVAMLNALIRASRNTDGWKELSHWLKVITTDLVRLARDGAAANGILRTLNATARSMNTTRSTSRTTMVNATEVKNVQALNSSVRTLRPNVNNLTQSFSGNRRSITQWGKDIQWVGRQIEFNFGLPLAAAAYLGTKFALDQERALTRIRKVYGNDITQDFTAEIERVSYAMELLSNHFGVNKSEVLSLAAAWAAAGLEGGNLADAVRATMEAMVVGDFESQEDAFQALVTITGSYNLSIQQLREQLAILNTIENTTASNFADLTVVIAKAGGAANTAGISIRELAAMATMLVPALGSAETAGNSLRSIISRLMSPTDEAVDTLREMGIVFDEFAFQSQNGVERIHTVAEAFDNLSDAQKANVSSTLASRWQVSRFDVLMRGIIDPLSTYNKTLEATADSTRNLQTYTQEINTVLASSPKRFEIAMAQIKNAMAKVILPLLPAIAGFAQWIGELGTKFAALDPATQKMVLFGLAAIGLTGTLTRLVGAFTLLFHILGGVAKLLLLPLTAMKALASGVLKLSAAIIGSLVARLVTLGPALMSALVSPWTLAFAAIVVAFIAFRDEIGQLFRSIVNGPLKGVADAIQSGFQMAVNIATKAFNALPTSIQNALMAVVNTVAKAAMAVYEWLQWMNPFARHSPSLVEQVATGVDVIASHYSRLSNIGKIYRQAADGLRDFLAATEAARGASTNAERGSQRDTILSGSPGAGSAIDALYASLDALRDALPQIQAEIDQQTLSVSAAEAAYEAMGVAVSEAQAHLEALRDNSAAIREALDAANERLDYFTSAGIEGMSAYDDAIFANLQRQKELELAILRGGDAYAEAYEKAKEEYEAAKAQIDNVQGEIEQLNGTINDLRASGAGSEILGPYLEQLEALKNQRGVLEALEEPLEVINPLIEELERLRKEAEILDLEKSLKFDALLREIERLTSGMHELPFEEILAGIIASKDEIGRLTEEYEANEAAIAAQEEVVAALLAREEALRENYERERAQLEALQDTYASFETQIRDMEAALSDMEQVAQAAIDALSGVGSAGGDDTGGGGIPGEGADFEDPIPNLDDMLGQDLEALIAAWEEEFRTAFSGIDPFGAIRDAWDKFLAWWDTNVSPEWDAFVDDLKAAWAGIASWFGDRFNEIRTKINQFLNHPVVKAWRSLVSDIWEDMKTTFGEIVAGFQQHFGKLAVLIGPLLQILQGVVAVNLTSMLLAWSTFWNTMAQVVGPLMDGIAAVIEGAFTVISGVFTFFYGIITLDWETMWNGLTTVLTGWWTIISGIFTNAWKIVFGIFEGAFTFLHDLWDAIWEMTGEKGQKIKEKIENIFTEIRDFIQGVWDGIREKAGIFFDLLRDAFTTGLDKVRGAWQAIIDIKDWLVNNVLNPIRDLISNFLTIGTNSLAGIFGAGINIIQGVWQGILTIWSWVRDNVIDPIRSAINNLFNAPDGMVALFQNGVNAIVSVWKTLANLARDPINFVIREVYNNGIRKVWNWIASKVGLPELGAVGEIPEFAKGGEVPGFGKGDTVPAMLTPGEFVLPTWLVDDIGIGTLESWRRRGLQTGGDPRHYAEGGYVRSPDDALNWAKGQMGKPWVYAAVGPNAYDCSGLTSALTNYILGRNPHARRHSSGTVQSDPAFRPGLGDNFPNGFAVGRFIGSGGGLGHISGTLAGTAVEATPPVTRMGGPARGATWGGYHAQFHLPGFGGLSGDEKGMTDLVGMLLGMNFPDMGPMGDLMFGGAKQMVGATAAKFYKTIGDEGKELALISYLGGPGTAAASLVSSLLGWDWDIPFFGNGGIVQGGRGGVLAALGEGTRGDLVTSLPPGFNDFVMRRLMANDTATAPGARSSGRTLNFYGDLSFPNIQSGDDANELISNLEALAGK